MCFLCVPGYLKVYILHVGKIFIKSLGCLQPHQVHMNPAHTMSLDLLLPLYSHGLHPNLGPYLSAWQISGPYSQFPVSRPFFCPRINLRHLSSARDLAAAPSACEGGHLRG